MTTPKLRSAAVLSTAALALAACGGGGSGTQNQGQQGQPPSSAPGQTGQTGSGAAPSGGAASTSGAPAAGGQTADGTLTIGTLLPQTGSLAVLGPPEIAGVDLAVKEINAAGGVLGKQVKVVHADSSDTGNPGVSNQSLDRLFGEKVDVVIGPASSGVALNVIDRVTGNGTLMISPANTSDKLTDYNDKGLYFRTAPPDKLQGRVLADTIAGDNNGRLAILALQDAYGTGLADNVEKFFEEAGGQVVEKIIYDPKAPTFAAEVGRIKAAKPDAIAVIAFDETKKILPELERQGLGPKTTQLYMTDGNVSIDFTKEKVDLAPSGGKAAKGTQPGAPAGKDLQKRLLDVNPKLGSNFAYGAEAYDATVLAALAATAARSDAPQAVAGKLAEVSQNGEQCRTYKTCSEALGGGGTQGADIDYEGVSGPIAFNAKGDPAEATIGIYRFTSGNKLENLDYVTGKLEE